MSEDESLRRTLGPDDLTQVRGQPVSAVSAVSAAEFALARGTRVAGYRVESLVGRGGAGAVYRAQDERLGRVVALKVMSRDAPGSKATLAGFVREAKAAAAVDHPNILPVFDAGETPDGVLYIAMRLVRGGDVRSLLNREGRLSPERTMAIIGPVAAALDEAHVAGLVHRDVKPGNMLLDSRANERSHVYLTDFGITTTQGESYVPGLTTGTVMGTPNYMAPEQVEGRSTDGRADQFGLACSAFEMLSGAPPFARDTVFAVMQAIGQDPAPALSQARPEIPTAVDKVFSRALAKSPSDRYGTCAQFAEALEAALGLAAPSVSGWTAGMARDDQLLSPASLDVPLKRTFRYVHEPFRKSDEAFASLGHDALLRDLERRIRHSRGGAFLITGFRGVGKSTMVMRALDDLAARGGPGEVVVPVLLSVARSTTTERLLFAVIRRVFETLSDLAVLERLPPQTRHALLVSYMRTSLSYKETQTNGTQQSAEVDIGLGAGKVVKAVADIAVPSVKMSASRSQSLATEAAFLAYSETDVEYDLMRIISLISYASEVAAARRAWWRWPWWRHPMKAPKLRLVIVLDEVDKLTVDDRGLAAVEKLLSGTKNVLATSGAHFLVIAGPDLNDRAIRDAARGSGVYESVFGWRMYVPCVWDAPEKLLADIVVQDGQSQSADALETLGHYLRFKARGVPRRLLQEINSYVAWTDDDQPRLRIGAEDLERVAFYARMERILRGYMEGDGHRRLFPVAIDEDRARLGSYFVVDWVLQQDEEPFTAADLLREGEDTRFDPLLRISRRSIDRLLDHLADHDVLMVVRDDSPLNTVVSDVAESAEKVFRLSDEIRRLLYGFAANRETERAEHFDFSLVVPRSSAVPSAQGAPGAYITQNVLPASRSRMVDGRYELGDFLEEGGLGTFYRGRDQITGRPVVVKLLRPAQVADPVALSRFRREAQIARKLDHEQVIKTYDFIDGPADFAIILERLAGPTLEELVRDEGRMSPAEVAGMGQVLADALAYLADQRVVRLDLKPANIIMADRGPVIADLGVAFQEDEPGGHDEFIDRITATGAFIGTPAYLPPEALEGWKPDSRVDIYALGLVMYFCLGGQTPWHDAQSFVAMAYRVLQEQVDLSNLGISEGFRAVLAKAIAKNRDERFSTADALSDALRQTPEWLSLRGEPSVLFRPTGRYRPVVPEWNAAVPQEPTVQVPRPGSAFHPPPVDATEWFNLNVTRQDVPPGGHPEPFQPGASDPD